MTFDKEKTMALLEDAIRNIEYTAYSGKKTRWRLRLLLARYAVRSAMLNIKMGISNEQY